MPVLPGVLILPLVGHLDSQRLAQIEGRLLQRIRAERTDLVIIDMAAVPSATMASWKPELAKVCRSCRRVSESLSMTSIFCIVSNRDTTSRRLLPQLL